MIRQGLDTLGNAAWRWPHGLDHQAHEEAATLSIIVLLGIDDVPTGLKQLHRDRGHDAGRVLAGEGQDVRGRLRNSQV